MPCMQLCAHTYRYIFLNKTFSGVCTAAVIGPEQTALYGLSLNKNNGMYNRGVKFDWFWEKVESGELPALQGGQRRTLAERHSSCSWLQRTCINGDIAGMYANHNLLWFVSSSSNSTHHYSIQFTVYRNKGMKGLRGQRKTQALLRTILPWLYSRHNVMVTEDRRYACLRASQG
jgi:hypothetical protein